MVFIVQLLCCIADVIHVCDATLKLVAIDTMPYVVPECQLSLSGINSMRPVLVLVHQ